jgi:prevent-host-death family protein
MRDMMMRQVKVGEAKERLADLIDAAVEGEVILITSESEKVVRLVPMSKGRQARKFGSARGLIRMTEDFEAPLADFREYME